jgi:hypothetical protein
MSVHYTVSNPECVLLLFLYMRVVIGTGEGEARMCGVQETGGTCESKEKEDDIIKKTR